MRHQTKRITHQTPQRKVMTSSLTAKHLAKSYKARKIIHDVSLSVSSGQVVGLLGPNGAGKTTCFYMIVGLVKPDHGEVLIDDQNITNFPMHGRANAGLGYFTSRSFDL